eukprot:366688_1
MGCKHSVEVTSEDRQQNKQTTNNSKETYQNSTSEGCNDQDEFISPKDCNDIYVIGQIGACGNKHDLTLINTQNKHKNITDIHIGNDFTIYSNIEHQRFYSYGLNNKPRKLQNITYFKKNNMIIKKLFMTPSSNSIFWITDEDKIYDRHKSYIHTNNKVMTDDKHSLLKLTDVIDIKCHSPEVIILKKSEHFVCKIIITHYFRIIFEDTIMPQDMINLIDTFYFYPRDVYNLDYRKQWELIPFPNNVQIVKIDISDLQIIYLDSVGTVWFGDKPKIMKYFVSNNIYIKDISCGKYHHLALSDSGDVYSWGKYIENDNSSRCGTQTDPQQVKIDNVIKIKCGTNHCYAKTHDGKHWLWGGNTQNQCIHPLLHPLYSHKPIFIDSFVNDKINKVIKHVFVGDQCTQIIV